MKSLCWELENDDYIITVVVTVLSRRLMELEFCCVHLNSSTKVYRVSQKKRAQKTTEKFGAV